MKKLSPASFLRRPRTTLFSLAFIILVASFGVSVSSNSSRPEEPQTARNTSPVVSQQGKLTLNSPLFTNPLFSALMPAVQITATMTDQIVGDGPEAGKAGVGETIRYTVTITNGTDPASNVAFALTTSTGTGLVNNSVIVSPIAVNDTYNSVGNMTLDTTTIGTLNSCTSPLRSVKCNDSLNSTNTTTTLTKFASTQGGLDAGPVPDGTNTVTTAHGTVKLDAEGAFIYNPTAGYEGTDEFWYRLSNNAGTDDGKVTITVGGGNGIVWFIDNDPPAASTNVGTQANPFTSLATFAGVNNGVGTGDTKPDANNTIFLFESATAYTGPVTLLAGQKFIGQDSTVSLATLGAPTAQPGNTYPSLNSGAPSVTIGSPAGGILLNQNNVLSGFALSGVSGTALQGTNFGTLALSDVNVNSNAQAISLTTGTLTGNGTGTATFSSISSGGGTNGILLSGVAGAMTAAGGSLTGTATGPTFSVVGGTLSVTYSGGITQAANNAAVSITGGHATGTITFQTGTISATNGTGLQFSNADGIYNFNGTTTLNGSGDEGIDILADSAGTFTFGANTSITSPNGIAFNVDGTPSTSTANVTYSGSITQASNFAMVNVTNHNTGTITFQTGTLNATNGTGLQFNNADSTTSYNFNGTTTLNGGDAGIDILSGSNGTFTFGTGVSITRANGVSGAAFNLADSNANVTYSGGMSLGTGTGNIVNIDNHDSGTITFQTGNLTKGSSTTQGISISNCGGGTINFNNPTITIAMGASGNAVSLTTNGGATINFTPAGGGSGVDITSTGNGIGFNATGGGTINVTGTDNTISTATGAALNVASTNIGASGMTFRSISANGAANGIVLNSTGTTAGTHGGLTVSGDGGGSSNGTGGTIQSTTGVGVLLTTTRDVSLNYMNITSTGDDGIRGQGVTNFTLTRSNLTTCGNATAENGIQFGEATGNVAGVFGSVTISNVAVSASAGNNVHVRNTSGTLDSFAVSNSSFNNLNDVTGANSFLFEMSDTAVCTLGTITSSTFQNNSPQRALEVQTHGTATITKFTVQTSTFNDNGIHASFTQDTASNLTFNFLNNGTLASPMVTSVLQAINVFTSSTSTGGTIRGRIEGNFIGNEAIAGSGSTQGNGIRVAVQGRTAGTILINNNRIRQVGFTSGSNGMILDFLGSVTAGQPITQSDLTLTNNDVATNAPAGTSPLEAILIRVDNQGSPARLRADVRNNTVPTTGSWGYPTFDGFGGQLSYVESVATAEGQLVDNAPTGSANADAELDEQTTGNASNVYGEAGIQLIPGPITQPPLASLQLRDNPRNQYFARNGDAPNSSDSLIALLNNEDSASDITGRVRQLVSIQAPAETSASANSNAQAQDTYKTLPQAAAGAHFSPAARTASTWKINNPFVASAEERVPFSTEAIASANPSSEGAGQMQLAHGGSRRKSAENSSAAMNPMLASPPSGEVINLNLGNLPGGKVVKIVFDVTVEGPHPVEKYTNQGSVTADGLGSAVLTDDPDIVGSANPTETIGDRYNVDAVLTGAPTGPGVTTSDNITFEVVVTPNQGSGVTPNGSVQFKDGASNLGAPVACVDNSAVVPNTCKATKQATLSAGGHTITAEYLGGTNHDPDTSNSLSYTAIACSNSLEVNSTTDTDDGTCDAGHCSLREAINNICANGTITFHSSVTGFIQIATTALPNLDKNMTITGPGAGVLEVRGIQTAGSETRIFNVTGTAVVNISGLTITKGGSLTGGAGINIASGATLNLSDSAVTFNIGTVVGGGGILNAGTLNLERSTVSNNTVTGVAGGGILNTGTLTVKNSTISTNTVNGGLSGGGVHTSGTATFVNSTIANNFAAVAGGGIFSSGTTNIGNTIVAYTAVSSGGAAVADVDGSFTSQGNNWIQDKGSATGFVASDQSGDPQIQPLLANNGGPTLSHAPLPGSPVRDAGSNSVATGLTTDQRGTGFPRTADSADAGTTQTVDIGAIEVYPDIENIANQTTAEDTQKQVTFKLGDDQIAPLFNISATSSNTTLVPNANISISSTLGESRTLTIDPAANLFGTTTVTVTITANNGQIASDTFDLEVTEVNDAPVPVNDTVGDIGEDSGVYSIPLATLSGNDSAGPNEGAQTLTITGVSGPTGGTVQINGANVEFTPTTDFSGAAGFSYTVQDNGKTNGSDDFKSAVGQVSFNVTAVNDKPVVTTSVGATAFTEGANAASTPVAVDSALTVTDVDSATLSSATVAITTNFQAGEDVLAFVNNSAATFGNIQVDSYAAGVLTLSSPGATATLTQWQNALRAVTYTNSSDTPNTSTRTVSFQVNDGAGANNLSTVVTKNVSVTATNDAPTLTNNGLTVNEGSTGNVIGAGALSLSDPDDTNLNFQVVSVPTNGTLKKSGIAMGVNDTFTQADVTGNLITYDHNGSETTSDSFGFFGSDGTNSTGNQTFNITVTPQNDDPVIAANNALTVVPGTAGTIDNTKLSVTDVDNVAADLTYTVGTAPAHGALKNNGTQLNSGDTFTQADIDGGLVTYTHGGNAATTDSFTFTVSDGAGGAIGLTTFNININCSASTVVSNTNDSGTGSLREAILTACQGNTVTFDATAFAPAGSPYTITLTTGELAINKNLTITGPTNASVIISGNKADANPANRSRIFNVASGSTVSISNLTVKDGEATGNGGAIYTEGTLTLDKVTVSDSVATGGHGGGIFNIGALTIRNSTLSGNYAKFVPINGGDGGAIDSDGGTLNIYNSTISGNRADGGGGGIHHCGNSTATLINVTVTANRSDNDNLSSGEGGGIEQVSSGTITLHNTIVGGNLKGTGGSETANDVSGAFIIQNTLIQTPGSATFTDNGANKLNQNPQLAALASNGGPTRTHLLLPGSPAINAGSNSFITAPAFTGPPFTDQRGTGFTRINPVGGSVDMGAVEVNYAISATTGTPQSATIGTAFTTQLQATVTESGNPQSGITVTFTAPNSGASGTFQTSGTNVDTATTNGSGVATAPIFTANGTVGGPYNVVASLAGGSPSADFALTNTKANQTITFNALAGKTYGDADFAISATSTSGLTVNFAASGQCTVTGNTVHITGAGSCTITASQPGDSNYNAALNVQQSFNIAKANQTITFGALSNKTYGDSAFTVSASSTSGLTVTFSSQTPAICGVSGNTVTIFGGGICTVRASQAGDSNYNAAPNIDQSFTIQKANQTITFNDPPDRTFGDADFLLNPFASTDSGQGVVFSVTGNCTVSTFDEFVTKYQVHLTGAGSCTVTASQPGGQNYNPATPVQQTFLIAKAASTTTVSSSANPAAPGQSVTFTATVTSPAGTPTGTVQFKADGNNLGAPVALNGSGVATVSTSTLTVGTHAITAEYSGDVNFNASNGTLSGGQVVSINTTVSINDVTLPEGDGHTKDFTFTLTLSQATNVAVSVDFSTSNGTATAGSDYQSAAGTVTFNVGDVTKTVTVLVNGDTTNEPNETFFVNLSNAQNTNITDNQGQATILNDDGAGVQFSANSYTFDEGTATGFGTVTVSRTGDVSQPLTVDYMTSDQSGATPCQTNTNGFASDRCDYGTATGRLQFAAGEASKTIAVVVINDAYVEPSEQFTIKLSNAQGGTLNVPDTATVTITDNDTQAATQNPIDNLEFFLFMMYTDFMGRVPDPAGFQFWKERMTANCPAGQTCDRTDTAFRFFSSDEFRERGYSVYLLYHAGLGRRPTYSEWIQDVSKLNGFKTVAEQEAAKDAFVNEFMNRQEFLNLYNGSQTGQTFVDALIQKSGITPASRQQLIDNYATVGRAKTLRAFMQTPEVQAAFFDRAFVTMLYYGLLRRDAEPGGFAFWMQILNASNKDYRFLIKGFLNSDEYRYRYAQISNTP